MIKILSKYYIFILAFCIPNICLSQFEGVVHYEISYTSGDPDTRSYIDMLPKKSMLYIKGRQIRLDQPIAGGGSQSFITYPALNSSILVMRLMGQKFQVALSGEQMQEFEQIQKLEIVEGSETKEIHGFKCQQAFALMGNDSLEIFYAPDAKTPCIIPQFSNLKGLLLEYEIINDKIRIKYSCNKIIRESIADEIFDVNDTVLKIPFEQFAQSFAIPKSPPIDGR